MKIENLIPLFKHLEDSRNFIQDAKWHPEGSVYNHSVQAFHQAMNDGCTDMDVILAALFHDLGKIKESHGHEFHSVVMCMPYLSYKTLWLIKMHMKVNYLLDGRMKKLSKIKELQESPYYNDLLKLNAYDKDARSAEFDYGDDFHRTDNFTKFVDMLWNYTPEKLKEDQKIL